MPTIVISGQEVTGVVDDSANGLVVELADGSKAVIPTNNPLYGQIVGDTNDPGSPDAPISSGQVDEERDRRIASVTFNGVVFQCDSLSQQRITSMGTDARFAVLGGAQAGNLRWASPSIDFGWIAADNTLVPMDAQTMTAFADTAKLWVMENIFAARALKDQNPIPADYSDNSHWP